MSIATQITRINNNIKAAYSSLENKGAVLPQSQNSANLTSTIDTIPQDDSSAVTTINKNVNFVGMSIWWYDGRTLDSSGFCGGVTAKGYQTLLKEQFTFSSAKNYCYSGYSLGATAASDAYSIMESAASSWTGSAGDIWTLDTITNDFKRNIPIGTFSNYENNTGNTTYYGALRAFKDRVNTLSGSTAIVICSNALRRNNSGYTSTSQNTAGHTLTDYEYALMNVAARNGWYFVDQFRLSGVTDDSIALTTLDGLHLNNFGYSLAAKPWIEQFDILAGKLNHTEALTVEIITGSYIKASDGGVTSSSNWNRTDYIKVTPGKTYRYYGSVPLSATGTSAVFGYDSSKAAVKQIVGYNVDASGGLYFTVPDGVEYIRCSSVNSVTLDVTVPDSTGYVSMAGDIANYYLKSDGTMTNSSGWRVTGKTSPIFVRQGESFKYIGTTSAGSGAGVVCVCGYDGNGDFVSVLVGNGDYSSGTTFTIPGGVSYIKACSQSTMPPELYKQL